jgi:ATP-binding cassette, subfamily B, bacterial
MGVKEGGRGHVVKQILRDVWRAEPRIAVTVVLLQLGNAVFAPLTAVALGLLVDAGIRGDGRSAIMWAVAVAVCDLGSAALNHPAGKLQMTLREKTNFLFEERLLRLSTAAGTLERLERPEYHEQVELARDRSSSLGDFVLEILAIVQAVVLLGVVFVALASVSWVLVLLIPVAVVTIYCAGRAELVRATGNERSVSALRLSDQLFDIATRAATAKDVKVSGAEEVLRRRFDTETEQVLRRLSRTEVRAVTISAAGWVVFSSLFGCAVGFVLWQAVRGEASAGQVLVVLTLALRLNENVGEVAVAFAGTRRASIAMRRLMWLYRSTEADDPVQQAAWESDPEKPAGSGAIELREVSFRYPGTENDVLHDLSLRLEDGTTVAVVGDNGAGKTTLVKLLLGLYPPTTGTILVGGRALGEIGAPVWQRSLSASFQDFVRFELLAHETVGVGSLARMRDIDEVWQAVDRGGARTVVEALPDGMDTQLGREWPGGVGLSLGQWQKLALSRAMMRRYPSLLVLDEPSASMDTAGEHQLYERFSRVGEFGIRTSLITLLVSHRFSTVRMADVIVLIRDGRATEVGSHDQLMALDGTYAELFELQAKGYRWADPRLPAGVATGEERRDRPTD